MRKKHGKLCRSIKKRFSWKLSLQVVRVLLGIFLVYAVYMIAISIIYHETKIKDQTEHYLQLAIDWTMPSVTTDISSMVVNNISPLLTQKIDMPLLKRIGKEEQHVSTMHVRKPLISFFFTSIEEDSSVTEDQLSFYLPYNPETGVKSDVISREQVWERLEMIHEGNVAQLAFSLEDYYTPEEVVNLLEPYDLDILWMPLYMGELGNANEGLSASDKIVSLTKPWGLAGYRKTNEKFRSDSMATILSKHTIKESEQAMLDNMERMLADRKGLAETFLQTDLLQERYEYLKKEGFQVYGAVVTGPVKELLKLREVEEIHAEQLGDIDYWNWVE